MNKNDFIFYILLIYEYNKIYLFVFVLIYLNYFIGKICTHYWNRILRGYEEISN
jgi:hypothetical protein